MSPDKDRMNSRCMAEQIDNLLNILQAPSLSGAGIFIFIFLIF